MPVQLQIVHSDLNSLPVWQGFLCSCSISASPPPYHWLWTRREEGTEDNTRREGRRGEEQREKGWKGGVVSNSTLEWPQLSSKWRHYTVVILKCLNGLYRNCMSINSLVITQPDIIIIFMCGGEWRNVHVAHLRTTVHVSSIVQLAGFWIYGGTCEQARDQRLTIYFYAGSNMHM